MTIAELTTFMGWMSIINIGLLVFSALTILALRNLITKIHSIMFAVNEQNLNKLYLQLLGQYKLLIIMFNIVPYIALKIMLMH